jgi:DNA invertase Pin-like site-specific DNA recombinase
MSTQFGTARRPRAGLYLRVSDPRQNLDGQRAAVVQLARARGFDVVDVYEERVSAAKDREQFDRLRRDAHAGRLDVVVVWALDRLARSMVLSVQTVIDLDRLGVQVVSVQEQWLDTGGPVRSLLVAIFGWLAEQERARISERVRCSIAKARADGRQIGRPRATIDIELAVRHRAEGLSIRQVARKLGIGGSTLHRLYQAHDALSGAASPGVPQSPAQKRAIGGTNVVALREGLGCPEGEPLGQSDTRTGT